MYVLQHTQTHKGNEYWQQKQLKTQHNTHTQQILDVINHDLSRCVIKLHQTRRFDAWNFIDQKECYKKKNARDGGN